MEVTGDPRVFAVQLDWDRRPTYKPLMHGVFCVLICGERLGLPFNQATLNSILPELHGWRKTIGQRSDPALMAADPVTAFLSIEDAGYGLEHLADKIPPGFALIPVSPSSPVEILGVDGLDDYRIYCVEDDAASRLLYARWESCRGNAGCLSRKRFAFRRRTVLADVLNRTIERLDGWFRQLPEPPGG